MDRLRAIYRTSELHRAHLLQELLERYDIRSTVVGEQAIETQSFAEVYVDESNEEVASGIAELFEASVVGSRMEAEFNELPPEDSWPSPTQQELSTSGPSRSTDWDAWPVCPQCGTTRQTICPICATAGRDFRLGELPGGIRANDVAHALVSDAFAKRHPSTSTQHNALLLCHGCDEPFMPRFYARCESCGHEFGEGIESGQIEDEALVGQRRALVGLLLVLAFALGILAIYR